MAGSAGVLSATARLHAAFSKPLQQRCLDITKVIDETSTKELHLVLPLLLENIFGFSSQMGWGLGRLTKSHHSDFMALRSFLAPNGPLLKLIHKLLLDPYSRYEFPTACLPYPSRHTLEEGGICPFYMTKVQFHPGHGRPFNMLSLNSFELYFFHFAYVLVNPNLQKILKGDTWVSQLLLEGSVVSEEHEDLRVLVRPTRHWQKALAGVNLVIMSPWGSPSDAMYPVLLEDYLNYFLPMEGKKLPPLAHLAAPVRSPVAHHHHQPALSPRCQPAASPTLSPGRGVNFSLLRTNLHQRAPVLSHQVAGQSPDPVEQETWRSQTLLDIFAEFWLNQNTLENTKSAFSQQVSPHGNSPGQHPNLSKIDPYYYIMVESFLPSSDHVRVVRMFIKHLHLFTATVRVEVISSPYSSPVPTPMDDLRRQVWPQLVQRKLYAFLRHGFERWPLDSSFRLMLETWLSFIQPWRYTSPAQLYCRDRDTDKDRNVDDKWLPFVCENLLFYTVLVQEFLPRVFRMDLSAPKNAYMLFRVSKVFNLPNLPNLIRDAESSVYEPVVRSPGSRATDLGGSYLSPGMTSRVASLNLQFTELEAPGFIYKPFYSDYTVKQIEEILGTITQAKATARAAQNKLSSNGGSWWSWLGGSAVDYNTHTYASYDYYDDLGTVDGKRLEAHLDQATANLCAIFEIPVPHDVHNLSRGSLPAYESCPESLTPDYIYTDHGLQLTPLGRYQVMNGLRQFDVQLRGDPETQRIRSYECAFLVRTLYQISLFLNEKYAREIEALYYREDFVGRLGAQYLTVPKEARSPGRPGRAVCSPGSREARALQARPRLSLRWLASYQNLAYISAFYLGAYFWLGLGSVGGLMVLILAGLLYGVFMALFVPHPRLRRD